MSKKFKRTLDILRLKLCRYNAIFISDNSGNYRYILKGKRAFKEYCFNFSVVCRAYPCFKNDDAIAFWDAVGKFGVIHTIDFKTSPFFDECKNFFLELSLNNIRFGYTPVPENSLVHIEMLKRDADKIVDEMILEQKRLIKECGDGNCTVVEECKERIERFEVLKKCSA